MTQNLQKSLTQLYGEREARSMVRIIYEDVLGLYRLQQELSPEQQAILAPIQQRLMSGEPLQYVLGQADFYGLSFTVDPSVLIPRQETEELVHWILETQPNKPIRLLDIGTGSGCIPVTLKHKRTAWQVEAADISEDALAVARQNAKQQQVKVDYYQLDVLDPTGWKRLPTYDVIVSNPPYIPPSESRHVPPHVLEHEPRLALFTETEDALQFYHAITRMALQQLHPDGWLYFELNEFNAEKVKEYVEKQGFISVDLQRDLNGKWRMLRAQTP